MIVNGFPAMSPGAPFGGYKQSGFGREGGRAGIEEFVRSKNVFIARMTPSPRIELASSDQGQSSCTSSTPTVRPCAIASARPFRSPRG